MTCPKCNSEQPDTTKFCSECAEPLARGRPSRAKSNRWSWFVLVLILIALVLVVVNIYNNELKRTVAVVRQPDGTVRAVGVPPVILPQPHYVPITNGAATVNAS